MPRTRSNLEKAAGKLIAAIQKEWTAEMGTPTSSASEQVLHTSHGLLQAASAHGTIAGVIGTGSIASFLGTGWVHAHPEVLPYIRALEIAQEAEHG
jgi:hypothetical protein